MAKKRKRARPSSIWEKEKVLRNFVAKYMHKFNIHSVQPDKTKYTRKTKHRKGYYE